MIQNDCGDAIVFLSFLVSRIVLAGGDPSGTPMITVSFHIALRKLYLQKDVPSPSYFLRCVSAISYGLGFLIRQAFRWFLRCSRLDPTV